MAFHTSGRIVVVEVTHTQWPGVIPKDHPWLTRTLMDTHTNGTYTMAWGVGGLYLVSEGGWFDQVKWLPIDLDDTVALGTVGHSRRCFLENNK